MSGPVGEPPQLSTVDDALRSVVAPQSYMLNPPMLVPSSCSACRIPLRLSDSPTVPAVALGTPPRWELCERCAITYRDLGGQVCDQTVFLTSTYAAPGSQSQSTMYGYKRAEAASQKSFDDLAAITRLSTLVHDQCLRTFVGGYPWDIVTYVPSTSHAGYPYGHPVSRLSGTVARIAASPQISRVAITAGPTSASRTALCERFTTKPETAHMFAGARVLLVEDAWVSGTSAQSAAAAIKAAGAASVTGLILTRWLRHDYPLHLQAIRQQGLNAPYDLFRCITYPKTCTWQPLTDWT